MKMFLNLFLFENVLGKFWGVKLDWNGRKSFGIFLKSSSSYQGRHIRVHPRNIQKYIQECGRDGRVVNHINFDFGTR